MGQQRGFVLVELGSLALLVFVLLGWAGSMISVVNMGKASKDRFRLGELAGQYELQLRSLEAQGARDHSLATYGAMSPEVYRAWIVFQDRAIVVRQPNFRDNELTKAALLLAAVAEQELNQMCMINIEVNGVGLTQEGVLTQGESREVAVNMLYAVIKYYILPRIRQEHRQRGDQILEAYRMSQDLRIDVHLAQ